jgi:uncharacterized protein (DUF1778 family)
MPTTVAMSRLEARITSDLHREVKRAAELQGRSLTDFVVSVLQDASRKALERSQLLELSRLDQEVFARALLEPPAPTAPLRRAVARHRKLLRSV